MTFVLSEEQRELLAAVNGFLEKHSAEEAVRTLMEQGGAADPAVWSQLAGQLGVAGLVIAEAYGGGGFGFGDVALVAEAAGAALLVAPLLATVSAAAALTLSADEKLKADYLPGLASGEQIGTLAVAEQSGSWDLADTQTTATPGADGDIVLAGVKMYVVDGQHADVLIVSARSSQGVVDFYAVDATCPEVSVTALSPLDLTRAQARVEFADAPARPLGVAGPRAERVLATAAVLWSADAVGGAQRCLDMAVEYAKIRVQFGKPIGSFQAIKHMCADMLLEVESARSAAYWAAAALDDDDADPLAAAALAKAYCGNAYAKVASDNIQVHGGIGFTWEHPAQLYFKRAKSSEILFGEPAWQRERMAAQVGL
ncbi:acyl-CoA/acyl-ACP dehydrogenase [Mycobacterium sp. NBC_00419]|uniref:acyl-CoA dehydrogenase family protein n=1 Tax=Mycobacterium sp. NBC_00419 TaxID=2975989 RepID=UPI002E1A0A73